MVCFPPMLSTSPIPASAHAVAGSSTFAAARPAERGPAHLSGQGSSRPPPSHPPPCIVAAVSDPPHVYAWRANMAHTRHSRKSRDTCRDSQETHAVSGELQTTRGDRIWHTHAGRL